MKDIHRQVQELTDVILTANKVLFVRDCKNKLYIETLWYSQFVGMNTTVQYYNLQICFSNNRFFFFEYKQDPFNERGIMLQTKVIST